jgi:hypothetical protein
LEAARALRPMTGSATAAIAAMSTPIITALFIFIVYPSPRFGNFKESVRPARLPGRFQ